MKIFRAHVLVCGGAGCISSGCRAVKEEFIRQLKEHGLEEEIRVIETGCVGTCDLGIVIIYPEGVLPARIS